LFIKNSFGLLSQICLQKRLFIFGLFAISWSCTPVMQSYFGSSQDVTVLPESYEEIGRRLPDPCADPLHYKPDTNHLDHTPMRHIRVNVHFMNSADSTQNFEERAGIKYAKGLIGNANHDLETNDTMFLPFGQNAPPLPTRYRYVLTPQPDVPGDEGVYFHYDDSMWFYVHKGKNRNLYDRRMFEKYGVQTDSVLNIFVMPHHPDSLNSKTYESGGVGVALGGQFLKMAGLYENNKPYWHYRQILNHEVGHIFGLSHTWRYNDGCDDTPKNRNYWHRSGGIPDSLVSNNLMDYNAYQSAWTPCQIGKVHQRMAQESARQRKFLRRDWCAWKEEAHIFIQDSVHWQGSKDLEGDITVEAGGMLRISCRVSLPRGAKISIAPGGHLIVDNGRLHNACGDNWQGIEIQQIGEKRGRITLVGDTKLENMVHPLLE